ncbi:hypothetical protein BCR33DRAFT_223096 [Rhizoclosmatium globosum]|uniref:Uncharacterized protein n=1 Tax=Rhizoclosmatium globosum TaxID=329046 RepID=A0A1Y2CBQ3_9FUNG|nr:hypothetical protein BCR33DRAFT_223096 [Rhizoclosmatium globosum]|eukprot:ORY44463.1 hypothetical protein BCR33DRAFT_223096 [Rhizoclosmatium globosum]
MKFSRWRIFSFPQHHADLQNNDEGNLFCQSHHYLRERTNHLNSAQTHGKLLVTSVPLAAIVQLLTCLLKLAEPSRSPECDART